MARSLITLASDFGAQNTYVPQMKGVIWRLNREADIVDISHSVSPFDIAAGARVLAETARWFPSETIHIGVVDPGVGSVRELLYARCGEQQFLVPNNGLLSVVARASAPQQLVALTNRKFWLAEVCPTFHGRDILAAVAGHLSLGVRPEELGERRGSFVELPVREPYWEQGRLVGEVVGCDSFGNLITNLPASLWAKEAADTPRAECCGLSCDLVATYSDRKPKTTVALVGSGGFLELAVVEGNAAETLGFAKGSVVALAGVRPR